MPTITDLLGQRANVWSQMTEIMDRTEGLPAGEDGAAYDAAEAELDALADQIERAQRHATLERSMAEVDRSGVGLAAGTDADPVGENRAAEIRYRAAFNTFIRTPNGILDLEPEARATLQAGYRSGDEFRPMAAAGVGTGAAGGFMVPPAFRTKIVEALLAYGPMLTLAERIDTETGVTLPWATNDDTANEGAILSENTAITEQDLLLGTNNLDAYMYTSKLVRVSYQLMQDAPNFEDLLARKLGERLARIYNRHATTGTGTNQPDGIVTSATVGATGTGSLATTGGVTYDNLVDVIESVDDSYLVAGNETWMMHQSVRKAVRKLKDAQQRPIWEPSVQAGVPDSLLGYPLAINNHMAPVAVNSKSLGFGDIREAYVIRMVRQNELVRLNERYADFLQVGFFIFGRLDGTLQAPLAFRVFQTTSTA